MNLVDAQSFADLAVSKAATNSQEWCQALAVKALIESVSAELQGLHERIDQTNRLISDVKRGLQP
jgi:hypothetical protein